MNIKNILCAILMMSAVFGHSVAVAVGCNSLKRCLVHIGVGLGAGVGGTLVYQQGKADSRGKQSLKTLAGTAVGATVGFAGTVLVAALINAVNNKR